MIDFNFERKKSEREMISLILEKNIDYSSFSEMIEKTLCFFSRLARKQQQNFKIATKKKAKQEYNILNMNDAQKRVG